MKALVLAVVVVSLGACSKKEDATSTTSAAAPATTCEKLAKRTEELVVKDPCSAKTDLGAKDACMSTLIGAKNVSEDKNEAMCASYLADLEKLK